MSIHGRQFQALHEALCAAFDQSSLEQMLRFRLDISLWNVVERRDLRTVVFDLIIFADQRGLLPDLVRAAVSYNPGNPVLKQFNSDYADLLSREDVAFDPGNAAVGNPVVEKPDPVRDLEQRLGTELQPVRTGSVTDRQNRRCYQLDAEGEIVGLNLHRCSITDGSCLKGLSHLTALSLEDNGITDGSFLKGLPRLTALDLGDNRITDSSFLVGLPHLTALTLWGNRIADGSFLKNLPHLTALDLSGNQFSDGSFLKGMTHLTSLSLRYSGFADWSFLKGMTDLTSLDLQRNKVDGSLLKGLIHLTALDLGDTRIGDWSFLKELTNLTSLDLRRNEIGNGSFLKGLTNLTALDLRHNKIVDGSFLKGLTNLTSLNLADNRIKDGSFLKSLTRLNAVDLRNNKLTRISGEMLRLNIDLRAAASSDVLQSIKLAGNPIETPPGEIVSRGDRAIRDWFAERDEGTVRLNEVKVILVGDGEAGKTTLRKRLMKLPPNPKESQTHGIEIHPHTIRCEKDNIRVHFWDFGGQEILHATHQFFLSRRSLYVVVLDGRKEEDVDYWLKHIESFGGDSPVLICLNKMDQNPSFDVNRVDLRAKYPGIREFYRLKCLDPKDDGVAQLVKELPGHLMGVELTRAEWPKRWFQVKEKLLAEGRPYLERSEFEGYCREAGILDDISQNTLIRFLNDLGVALHFDDERLDLVQILNPKWATQAVYRLLSAPRVAAAHGLLKLGDLKDILAKAKSGDYDYPKPKHGYILDLMRKFELCYDVTDKEVLLPDLLGVGEPSHEFPTENVLRLRYEYEYLPKSIMPRLIVKLHPDIEGKLRWRTGVVLKPNKWSARARVRSDKSAKRITIEVAGFQRRDYFAVISDTIETIHEGFTKLEFKRKVPLPDRPQEAVDYEDLIYHRELKRRTILVGSLKKEYPVDKLLDGVDLAQKRKPRAPAPGPIVVEEVIVTIGDNNRNIAVAIGENITQAVADTLQNSFNKAGEAKADQLKTLLERLALEMAKVIEKLPAEKASEAARHLETATKEATAEKPSKSFWEFSKQGMIDAATVVGAIGTTALGLIDQIATLLQP